jgi:hypothetical protein
MRQEIKMTQPMSPRAKPVAAPERISLDNPQEVRAEVKKNVVAIFGTFDFRQFDRVFNDIIRLFHGKYPGYRPCNTLYHDLSHTMDCLLVTAKLIHGASLNGVTFEKNDVCLGLISALMHDTGYIQAVDDKSGTGAKYTVCHIERSIEFLEQYFKAHGFPAEYAAVCSNFLRCTGLEVKIAEINFKTPEHEILGQILGAADLIGQMANENYLEKLPFLYHEFREAGVPGYNNEFDLLKKTPAFWEMVKKRLVLELGHVDRYLRDYLRILLGINQDLYRQAIDRNIERLQSVLSAQCLVFPGIGEPRGKWV